MVAMHFFVRFEPRPEQAGAFRELLRETVSATRAEAGCRAIQAFESLGPPARFAVHSEWADEAAFDLHASLPHTVKFLEAAGQLLSHPVHGFKTRPLPEEATATVAAEAGGGIRAGQNSGRPQRDEAAEYYWRYIDRVPGENGVAVLAEQLGAAAAFFNGITAERSSERYAPEKWSIRQTLGHISDSERIFALRALWVARGLTAPQPGFDQEATAAAANADAVAWPALRAEFARVRLASLSLFESLPAAAWRRRGIASGQEVSVRALAFIIAGHLDHHMAILRERYRC